MTTATLHELTPRSALEELASRKIKRSFEALFRAFPPADRYVYGRHTLSLLHLLDKTTKQLEQGVSSYRCICMPPRHGKSDVASRRYGAWHLIRNPDHEFILTSYNYSLASDMSYELRRVMRRVGPMYGINLQADRGALDSWRVAGHKGAVHAAGLGGTITGRGADVLLVDDYFKNREEAESDTQRQRKWESFESDLLTRLSPVHAVVIVANRWHEDDIVGRILRKNDPDHEDYDEDFPPFEYTRFPAQDENGRWLFQERFGEAWYKTMRAFMGTYAWNAQAQQDPQPRTGNLLQANNVQWITAEDLPNDLTWRRGWDVASTEKERIKDDPDYTVGTLAAYDFKQRRLYVRHVVRGQWTAPKRDRIIRQTAIVDGANVQVRVEAVAGYKDTYEHVRDQLRGAAVVRKVVPSTDKVARASVLEPVFESGDVYVVKGPWNRPWQAELMSFPSSKHKDQVDSLVVAVHDDIQRKGRMSLGRVK